MLASLVLALASSVSDGPPSILQPKTYVSPSGEWSLTVDPTRRLGGGPGRYRMMRGDAAAWEGERPFTFWEAAVADSGHCAGYAYTEGEDRARGDFVVAVFSPSGDVVLDRRQPRTDSSYLHGPPDPLGTGVFVQPALGRVLVRVIDSESQQRGEEWQSYGILDGAVLGAVRPEMVCDTEDLLGACYDARAVAGTPLVLSHWNRHKWSTPTTKAEWGVAFVLLDDAMKPVWRLDLAEDLEGEGDAEGRNRAYDDVWRNGCVFECNEPGRFEIRSIRERVRIKFEVARSESEPSGWSVLEVARSPYATPEPRRAKPTPPIALRKIESVPLGTGASQVTDAIRDVIAFTFDERGAIRFVRREGDSKRFSIVALDSAGELEREVRVDEIDDAGDARLEWWPLGPERWLATRSPSTANARASAWRVDGASGAAEALADFDCPPVEAIESARDGGFVVLGTYRFEYTMSAALARFDADGNKLWERSGDLDHEDPSALFAAKHVAVLADGRIIVLDNIRNTLQVFRDDGEFAGVLDLETAWGQEPRYPTAVLAEPSGALLIHDFHGSPSWWRMDLDGTVLAKFDLTRADGGKDLGRAERMHVAPDGHLWSTNGRVFLRFDARGRVDREIGPSPNPQRLEEPRSVHIDTLGRIMVEDARTHALHAYDATGAPLLVAVPDASDFEPNASTDSVVARADGSLMVRPSMGRTRNVEFDSEGHRLTAVTGDYVRLAVSLGTGDRWGVREEGFDVLELVHLGAGDDALGSVARSPDGSWFRDIEGIGVGRDGTLAVVDDPRIMTLDDQRVSVCLYAPDGTPLRMLDLPGARPFLRNVSVGARWVVVSNYGNDAWLVPIHAGRAHRVVAPDPESKTATWAFALSPDERELWCAQSSPPTLHRYALPAE